MSNILSIETSNETGRGFSQQGFVQMEPKISDIKEGANISGTLLNKLGTSIPTPFARLHLFNSAFKEVNNSKGKVGSNYMKLVSLALDMYEFLYLFGASSSLSVIEWNVDNQTERLINSDYPGHKELGEALLSAWNNAGYEGRNLYLFKFEDEVIGGNSALSG